MNMEWISVEDRLPDRAGLDDDEPEYVLVAEKFDILWGAYRVAIRAYMADGWDSTDNYFAFAKVGRVTHWMPLPQPPKNSDFENKEEQESC